MERKIAGRIIATSHVRRAVQMHLVCLLYEFYPIYAETLPIYTHAAGKFAIFICALAVSIVFASRVILHNPLFTHLLPSSDNPVIIVSLNRSIV